MLDSETAATVTVAACPSQKIYKQKEMLDFILDVVLTLEHESDFDKDLVKKVLGSGLKEKFPLTRYYIPRHW